MYHYVYVSRNKAKPFRDQLVELIHDVQNDIRDKFTFQFRFVGSSSRNMITFDPTTNKGFDFDVNLEINDYEENYSPMKINDILFHSISKNMLPYGYQTSEKSTRVITIKRVDYNNSSIENSCDFALVFNGKGQQQAIRFNKKNNTFTLEDQRISADDISYRADELKRNNYWTEVREYYLYKKNNNTDPNKHSMSLYSETINELYSKYYDEIR